MQVSDATDADNHGAPEELERLVQQARSLENDSAEAYLAAARKATELAARQDASSTLRLKAMCELGNAYRVNADYANAIETLSQVIDTAPDLLPEADRYQVLALAHLRSAIVYDVINSVVAGLEQLQHAARYYRLADDRAGLAKSTVVRGALYSRINDTEHAAQCFEQSLEYYRSVNDRPGMASALSNLCVMYRILGRHDDAIAAGRQASELAESRLLQAAALSNLAYALTEAGRLSEAEAESNRARKLLRAVGDHNYLIEHQRLHADIIGRSGRLEEARDELLDLLGTASAKGLQRNVTNAHHDLAQVYADLGDYENALRHFMQFHDLALADSRVQAQQQLELHKFRLELEQARNQAQLEREQRERLAKSFAELGAMHDRLSAKANQLEWYSHRDGLTELANRRYFDERLSRESNSESGPGALSLIMLDIDEFKAINDRYGHVTGDEVLRQTARLLESNTRRVDLCARLGGEEFAVILAADLSAEKLFGIAEGIRCAFEEHDWSTVAPGLTVTVSVGLATLREADGDPVRLLELADERLYASKKGGRNRVSDGQQRQRPRR